MNSRPIWTAPLTEFRVTSCYGPRWGRIHGGIDLAAPYGRLIRAVGAGQVIQAGWQYRGYGYSVAIRHPDGYVTFYGHASTILVTTGQNVVTGQPVARVGSTGRSTGPHLHLGVMHGTTVSFNDCINPSSWLKARGIGVQPC